MTNHSKNPYDTSQRYTLHPVYLTIDLEEEKKYN